MHIKGVPLAFELDASRWRWCSSLSAVSSELSSSLWMSWQAAQSASAARVAMSRVPRMATMLAKCLQVRDWWCVSIRWQRGCFAQVQALSDCRYLVGGIVSEFRL